MKRGRFSEEQIVGILKERIQVEKAFKFIALFKVVTRLFVTGRPSLRYSVLK